MRTTPMRIIPLVLVVSVTCDPTATALGQQLEGDALAEALAGGGYVIVMRHASATPDAPPPQQAVPANVQRERQLDEEGRATMTAMRSAFRRIGIPVGDVHSSPAFRAVETANYLGFGTLQTHAELGTESPSSSWLRRRAAEPPREGTNAVIVTHARNLTEAFREAAQNMRDGEALVFHAGGGAPVLVARLRIEQWAALARS